MKLFINKNIGNPSDLDRWYFGNDDISFSTIHDYMQWANEWGVEDPNIDVEIHSCGGDTVEGYAIYDALRTSGKNITCTVVGTAASMATVILLAAPADKRFAYEHARLLIHHPYYAAISDTEITTAKLEAMKRQLEAESAKMLALYVERTGMDEETIKAQMDNGGWFDASRAKELGLISGIVPATSAAAGSKNTISTTIKPETEMKIKDESSAIAKAFMSFGKAIGLIEDEEPKALVLTDVNGTDLNFETEDSDVKVGDKTDAADGEYTLEDGRVVVVEDGVVTEIKEKDEETDEEVEALKAEVAELKKQLEDANAKVEDANAKQAELTATLAKMQSNYTPAPRKSDPKQKGEQKEEPIVSKTSQRLADVKAQMAGK